MWQINVEGKNRINNGNKIYQDEEKVDYLRKKKKRRKSGILKWKFSSVSEDLQ